MASRFRHSRRTRSRAYDGAHNTSGHNDSHNVRDNGHSLLYNGLDAWAQNLYLR